ncbi:MAG TPA: T9SS type A sorting domain-containing protein, partial [Saprospiraceae bacterium]|nr:T9SS type A sorting domain-containing protein [Saprospiraceae bacterium]
GYPYCDPDIKVVTSTNQHVAPYSDDVATTLYPNPADNRVTIRSSHVIRSVSIIDMTGRTVIIPEQWPDTVWEADVSRLPEGVYWVRIDHSGKERTIFKKLIILR